MAILGDEVASEAVRQELLGTSNEGIEAALEAADPMVLRGLLYQLTGDEKILAIEAELVGAGLDAVFTPSEEDVATLRAKAAAFLCSYRDAGAGPIDPGPLERFQTSLGLTWGQSLSDDQASLYVEELGLDPWARSLQWERQPDPKRLEEFNVVVIGSGYGGLIAALQLKRAGIPYKVIEKNADIGGTWFENRYPGVRVDVPSRGYTHLVGAEYEWGYAFSPGADNRGYIDWLADRFDLRDEIEFNTEVHSLRWDEETSTWEIRVGEEGERSLRARAVITATGFLSRPNMPQIEGMEDFKGPSFHTARWPQDFDHEGKRIAVIGTGATGYQLVPQLALEAGKVVVFQRTPQWVAPTRGYLSQLPQEARWLERNFPYYRNFLRFRAMLLLEGLWALSQIDESFDHPDAVNPANLAARESCLQFLAEKLKDPELVATMTPPHPFGSARSILIDASYSIIDAIQRDNVTLVSDGIRRITETGVIDGNGVEHEVDAIVYATGYRATEYLFPMQVEGRGGKTIEEVWADGGARGYLNSMVPDFPNLWMVLGPNTNGSLMPPTYMEMVTLFAMRCIERLIVEDENSVEPTEEAYWRFADDVDQRNRMKVWSDPRAHNYYWTEHGRSAVMSPFPPAVIWRLLRDADLDELDFRGRD